MREPAYYFNLDNFGHRELFEGLAAVWEVLARIESYIAGHLRPDRLGTVMEGAYVSNDVYLGSGTVVEPGAMIKGPAIIGANTVVRQGAYIREQVIVGDRCIVGHSTELKQVVMLDGAQAPHFNYVGDSVLGRSVNLGAGTKVSNFKNDGSAILVRIGGETVPTGLRKFGAIIGDGVSTGCNSVLSPGTLVGPGTLVYPNAVLRGFYAEHSIVKLRQTSEVVERR